DGEVVEVVYSPDRDGISMDVGISLYHEPFRFHIAVENLLKSKMDYLIIGDISQATLPLGEIPTCLYVGFEYTGEKISLTSTVDHLLEDRVEGWYFSPGRTEHRFLKEFFSQLSYRISEVWYLKGGLFISHALYRIKSSMGKEKWDPQSIIGFTLGAEFKREKIDLNYVISFDTRRNRLKEVLSTAELKPVAFRVYTGFRFRI
ncbi:MAG: hypothetical protein ACE5QV_07090, partial [Fidelibacterota bacterium]